MLLAACGALTVLYTVMAIASPPTAQGALPWYPILVLALALGHRARSR